MEGRMRRVCRSAGREGREGGKPGKGFLGMGWEIGGRERGGDGGETEVVTSSST